MSLLSKKIIPIFVISFVLLAILSGIIWFHLKAPPLGGAFELVSNEKIFKFDSIAKPLNLIYFGYTKCPDVCPMSLSYAAQAFLKLNNKELQNIQFIFISVDHEHDTNKNVLEYAHQFHDSFLGVTGNEESIDAVVKLFGAGYFLEVNPKSYIGYSITHTDRIFYTNKTGRVIDSLPNPRDPEIILNKIKENL